MSSGETTNESNSAGVADLHTHTTASDGTITVDQRIDSAREMRLEAIAITDHDIISANLNTPSEDRNGVEVITGVEVRADLFDTKIEILGYFVNPEDAALQSMLNQVQEFRQQRNEKLVENLDDTTDLALSYEDVSSSVDRIFGRPHLAELLVEEGIVNSVGEAFSEYLAEGGAAFVPMQRLPAEEVVSTLHEAGGATVLAHPGRIRTDESTVETMVETLTRFGLAGIETWYPYDIGRGSSYASVSVDDAFALAEQFDLVPTGGSDCHGPDSGKYRMGEVRVSSEYLEKIRRKAPSRSAT